MDDEALLRARTARARRNRGGNNPGGISGAAGPAGAKVGGNRPFGRTSKQKLLEEFDANGDGKLDAKERLTMTRTQNERRRAEAEGKKPAANPDEKADVKN